MYVLINTMSAVDLYVGKVLSVHRTRAKAEEADAQLQRQVQCYNGANSYLPTIIGKCSVRVAKGDMVHQAHIDPVEE